MTDKEKRELKDGVISIFKRFNILDHTATIGGLRDDILRYIDSLQEEPVSKDLEEASKEWLSPQLDKSYAGYGETKMMELTHFDGYAMLDAIEFGAEWKEEQFEKNRLAHCDAQTEEEAEIERDFVMGIIENEHRQPTFDDAIKYGMRLKEKEMQSTIELAEDHAMLAGMEKMKDEMMAKAYNGEVVATSDNGWESVRVYKKKEHSYGQKVKVIVIKED